MLLHGLKDFRFSWWVASLAIASCATTIRLGFWQLDRAEQKKALAKQWERKSSLKATSLDSLTLISNLDDETLLDRRDPSSLHYTHVLWLGTAQNDRVFLVDNRMRGPRAGFEVLTPVATKSGWVLLNRGWVEKEASHYDLPPFTPLQQHQGRGHIYVPAEPLTLGNSAPTKGWPKIVQAIDFDRLSNALGQPLLPFTVRAESGDNTELNIDWPGLELNPDKNIAYAVQWFAISLALLVGFITSGIGKRPALVKRSVEHSNDDIEHH